MRKLAVLKWAGFCAGLLLLGLLGARLRGGAITAPVWPASAVIMAVALRGASGPFARAAVIAVGVISANIIGLAFNRSLPWVLGMAGAGAVEIAIGLAFLKNMQPPILGGRGFLRLVLGASLLGPLASTAIATAACALLRSSERLDLFALRWFAAHALSMLVCAPVLLSIVPKLGARPHALSLAAILACVVAVTALAVTWADPPSLVLVAPLMALSIFAGGEAGAAITLALTGLTAAALTAAGFGCGAAGSGPYVYQAFLACLAVAAHALVGLMRLLEGYSREIGQAGLDAPRGGPAD